MSFDRSPLGLRLTLWFAGVFAAGIGLVLVISYFATARALRDRDRLAILGRVEELQAEYRENGIKELKEEVEEQHPLTLNRYIVRLCRADGATLLLDIPRSLSGLDPLTIRSAPCAAGGWSRIGKPGDDRITVFTAPFADKNLLQVGLTDAERRDILARMRRVALLTLIPAFLFAAAAGYFLVGWALLPLRALVATAAAIEAGNLSARVSLRGNEDELDALGRLFNRMLDRIGRLISGMREALDDIAHELRTPMTRLRASAEGALNSRPDTEADRAALAECLEEAQRVTATLDTLMDLAEAESGASRQTPRNLELRPLLEESAELFRLAAEESGRTLELRCDGGLVVRGDAARLRRILSNLLDNAVKYGGTKGRILFSARRSGERVEIAVEDEGPGIGPDDLPRIFDRLYRAQAVRRKSGLGLGLSLVKALAQAQGGTVSAENVPGGGARFRVLLVSGA